MLRSFATLAVAVGVATCADAPTAADSSVGHDAARVGFAPVFSAAARVAAAHLADFGITFDHVRVVIVRPVADTVKDTTIAFVPGQANVTLDLPVAVRVDGESFHASIDYTNPTGVVFHGEGTVQSHPVDEPAPTQEITIQYAGPGATVTRIVVAPKTPSVVSPFTITFTATGFDANNAPVPGTLFSWTTSDPTVATISSSGTLTALGKRGTVTVTAVTPNNISDNTTAAITLPASAIALVSGGGQIGKVGTALAQPAVVRVTARDGLGVAGVPVSFAPPAGGKVGAASVTTDASGTASTSITLGSATGAQSFVAVALGFSVSIPVTATVGDPAGVAVVSGGGQSDTVRHGLKQPLVVKVVDQFDNPVSNITVNWARRGGSGALSAATSVTDAGGLASNSYTLGVSVGIDTISATVAGATTAASFSETSLAAAPAVITTVSGTAQTGRILQPLAPFVVKVTDDAGNPVAGATVAWTVTNGTLTAPTTTTDALGQSSNIMTLGSVAGVAAATATVSGKSTTFSATVQTGIVAKMIFQIQPPGTGTSGTALAPAIQVALQDAGANLTVSTNPVTIALGANPSGGTLTGTLTRNAVGGVATFDDLKVDKVGGYTLVVTSAGIGSLSSTPFAINPGAPTKLAFSVNPTNTVADSAIRPPVAVNLLDAAGNNATGATDSVFVAIAAGTGTAGAILSGGSRVASAKGVATFSGLNINTPGAGYVLVATGLGLTQTASTAFTIAPAPPSIVSAVPASLDALFPTTRIALNGTHFVVNATTVGVSGGTVTTANLGFQNTSIMNLDLNVVGGVPTSVESITLTTAAGVSAPFPFTIFSAGTAPVQVGAANGGGGGTPYTIDCPLGTVGTGLNARGGTNVDQIQLICQPVTGVNRVLGASALSGTAGAGGGAPATLACPANYVLVGLSGFVGAGGGPLNDLISGICTPITGGADVTTGSVGSNNSGSVPYNTRCPAGLALTGIQGGAGNLVDRTQIRCR
ncbi:MAG: Ig-like domain-containing protein [bacterium]